MGDILLSKTVNSVDAYTSAGVITIHTQTHKLVFQVTEQNVKACKAKILASNRLADDGTLANAVTLLAETVIAKAGTLLTADGKVPTLADPWRYIDLQYASNAAGNPGTLHIDISGA